MPEIQFPANEVLEPAHVQQKLRKIMDEAVRLNADQVKEIIAELPDGPAKDGYGHILKLVSYLDSHPDYEG